MQEFESEYSIGLYFWYTSLDELFSWRSSFHSFSRMCSFDVPIITVFLCLHHESFFCPHLCSKWYKKLFIITSMGSFNHILSYIEMRIITIYARIKKNEEIIPLFLFLLTSGEELTSSIRMKSYMVSSLHGCVYTTISEMRENIDQECESKRTTLSSRICHKSHSTSHIHNIPFIYRDMFIVFEVLVYMKRKGFLICNLFGVIVHIFKSSKGLVVIERPSSPILRSYFFYSKPISFIDSLYLGKGNVWKQFFPRKKCFHSFCTNAQGFKVLLDQRLFILCGLARMGVWLTRFWEEKSTSIYIILFKRYSLSHLLLKPGGS